MSQLAFRTKRYPLMALSRQSDRAHECPLSGVKRTWRLHCEMSACEPKRTLRRAIIPDAEAVLGWTGFQLDRLRSMPSQVASELDRGVIAK